MSRPASVYNKWTAWSGSVLIGAWDTRAELDEWMSIPMEESVMRIPKDTLTIEPPR